MKNSPAPRIEIDTELLSLDTSLQLLESQSSDSVHFDVEELEAMFAQSGNRSAQTAANQAEREKNGVSEPERISRSKTVKPATDDNQLAQREFAESLAAAQKEDKRDEDPELATLPAEEPHAANSIAREPEATALARPAQPGALPTLQRLYESQKRKSPKRARKRTNRQRTDKAIRSVEQRPEQQLLRKGAVENRHAADIDDELHPRRHSPEPAFDNIHSSLDLLTRVAAVITVLLLAYRFLGPLLFPTTA